MKFYINMIFLLSFSFSNNLNIDLLSNFVFDENASDITGFNQDGREFAVVGLENASSFLDITNPFNPVEIVRIEGGNSAWRDIKYWNRHVYIGTEANQNNGIQIVSVDNLDAPVLVNTITDFGSSHNIWIDNEGFLYVVGTLLGCDIWIYSLENPSNPIQVGCWEGEYIHDIDVFNNKLYASAINSSTIYILDISNKTDITVLTSWEYEGKAHDCSISENENILVTADEMTSGHLKIWDITNYNNIQLLGEYSTDIRHSIHNVYIKENLVYCSYYADGIRVIDISYPTNPSEVAYFDTSDLEGVYVGNWGVFPYLESENIIVSDIDNGLFVLNLNGIAFIHEPLNNQGINVENYTIISRIVDFENDLNNCTLFYRNYIGNNNPWQSIAMSIAIDDLFFAQIPKEEIGSLIQYYIEASNNQSNNYYYPVAGISEPFFFIVGELPVLIKEDFELFESSSIWINAVDDDASSGIWDWGIPNGTQINNFVVQPYTDTSINGINCFLTGNAGNEDPYFDDVDNGKTTLISPTYNFIDYDKIVFNFSLWFSNGYGTNPNNDSFLVDISNDSGSTWINLNTTNKTTHSWINKKYILSDFLTITDEMLLRFTVSDILDSSLVEAAVDDIYFSPFGNPYILGDSNFDNSIDILDIVYILDYIYGNLSFNLFELQASDYYIDGNIDVLDIVALIDLILSE